MTNFKYYLIIAIGFLCLGVFLSYVIQTTYTMGVSAGFDVGVGQSKLLWEEKAEAQWQEGFLECNSRLVNLAFNQDSFAVYDSNNGNAKREFVSVGLCYESWVEWSDFNGD